MFPNDLRKIPLRKINPFKKYIIEKNQKKKYKNWIHSTIKIQPNTLKRLAHFIPVILTNSTTDTLTIGSIKNLPLCIEAKDSLGKWKTYTSVF